MVDRAEGSDSNAVSENQRKFQRLLRDLFQFDTEDLDFGIYRVMNQRRDIIEDFIEEDLIETVHDALEDVAEEEKEELRQEVDEAREKVVTQLNEDVFTDSGDIKEDYRDFGVAQDYLKAKERLDAYEVAAETEARIFNDLYRFFSRFYEDGDFHAKRRFSSQESKYYIPYNGEEVYFHWANRDQYYVKTSEHFTTYRFEKDDYTVEFSLEDANVPQDNVKGDDRYFVLGTEPVSWNSDKQKLTITFQYRLITENEAQEFVDTYNEATGDGRKSFAHKTNTILCTALQQQILEDIDDKTVKSLLQRDEDGESLLIHHLKRYTSENTMDYFVHKNLGEFLHGELDFYLQNEVLNTEELLEADPERDPASLLRARVVRTIAERIIDFLADIENFQKRLFEKKKFVTQTDYMVTLDQVPEELYDDILENNKQLEQWRDVYNTDEWGADLAWQGEFTRAVLNQTPHLMIDTALFSNEFKHKLLASFDDIEEETDGVLLHGENFQAMNLLLEKYRDEVSCTYIDPPYNTGNDDFIYKDRYQHSSWLSMMSDRLSVSAELLSPDGVFFGSIDDNEQKYLNHVSDIAFTDHNQIGQFIWKSRQNKDNRTTTRASIDHEYILCYGTDLRGDERDTDRYTNPDNDPRGPWASENMVGYLPESERPNLHYELVNPETGVNYGKPEMGWRYNEETMQRLIEEDKILWPDDPDGRPRRKVFLSELDDEYTGFSSVICDDIYTYHGTEEIENQFGERVISFPKPSEMVKELIEQAEHNPGPVLDFFAGSGTTAHAVLKRNKETRNRQYILVEVADHFDEVIRPRIQKLVLSLDWEEGVPQNRDGQSHLVKYHRLESYEDALNNVELVEPEGEQQRLVEQNRAEYVSGYLFDFEAQGQSLLVTDGFEQPFKYELEIEQNGGQREDTTVDLVETFHYLIGAKVRQFNVLEHQEQDYVVTRCDVETENGIDSVLTVWRNTEDLDLEEEAEWFKEEFEGDAFDRIYVNSECFIDGAEPVEVTFQERMEGGSDGAE